MVDDLTHKALKKQRNPHVKIKVPDSTPENPKMNVSKMLQRKRRMTMESEVN